MTDLPPHDLDAEAGVLGACMLAEGAFAQVDAEVGLQPASFYLERNRTIYQAISLLTDDGAMPDAVAVCAELKRVNLLERAGGESYVHSLPTTAPSPGAFVDHAQIVKRLHLWRVRRETGIAYIDAAARQDEDAFAQAEQRLGRFAAGGKDARSFDPEELASDFVDTFDAGGMEGWQLPFDELTEGTGGLNPGGLTLVGGHTSHGKSVLVDQCLQHAHLYAKLRGHLYINEMNRYERTARTLAYMTGVPHDRIRKRDLERDELVKVTRVLNEGLPFGLTEAHGWSVQDIARHVRHHRFELVVVDLLHLIPNPPGISRAEGLGEIAGELKRLAGLADCHVIATVHLNEQRVQTAVRPHPTLGDIRDSGMPKNHADNVVFIWLEQDSETGRPVRLPGGFCEGLVYTAKTRSGGQGGLYVRLHGERMRIVPDRARGAA